VSLICIRSI